MRELRFRGKLLKDSDSFKTYKKGTIIQGGFCSKGTQTFIVAHFNVFEVEPESVLQFTGLKDKNGKHIYEGDVLEFRNDLGRNNLHKVFRVDGGLAINSHSDDISKDSIVFYEACADMQTSQWIRQCEVIGNIHQNPELINN